MVISQAARRRRPGRVAYGPLLGGSLPIARFSPDAASIVGIIVPDPHLCQFDPDQSNILGASMGFPHTITSGDAFDLPIQCRPLGGVTAGVMGPMDTVTIRVIGSRQATPAFTPAFSWYTAGGTQTGYDQAQVLASWDNAQGALIQPSSAYTVAVYWAPASAPSRTQLVARIPIVGKAVAP